MVNVVRFFNHPDRTASDRTRLQSASGLFAGSYLASPPNWARVNTIPIKFPAHLWPISLRFRLGLEQSDSSVDLLCRHKVETKDGP